MSQIVRKFYGIYATGLLFVMLAGMLGGIGGVFLTPLFRVSPRPTVGWSIEVVIYTALFGLAGYLVVWPYLAARFQEAVWTNTALGGVIFTTEIRASTLSWLVLKNVVLTLASCGLYWQFAAVALARYRIECLRVWSPVPLDAIAVELQARPVTAAGEGALDAFGMDLGL